VKRSLPHLENGSQQSINNFWCCIFRIISGTGSQASIYKDMAAFIGRYIWDIPATSSMTVTTYFMYRATTKYSWAFYHTKTVKTMYIDRNSHIILWLSLMQGQQSLMLRWRSFSRRGWEHFTSSYCYQGGHCFVYDCLHPVISQIT